MPFIESKKEIEKVEKKGQLKKDIRLDERVKNYLEKASKSKSFESWLNSRIKIAYLNQNSKDLELATYNKLAEIILNEVLKKYKEFSIKPGQEKIEVEILDSWKGKSELEFYEGFTENIIIVSHQKNKDTGEIEKIKKEIPKENVNRMLFLIKRWHIGESHTCYEVANLMGYDWKEDVWKNRKTIYWFEYYYPLKVLEALRFISYSGRGVVVRLK